jgi:hypothetical protein
MNIALEKTEEYVIGAVINRYGDTFVRGNNGTSFPLLYPSYTEFASSPLHIRCRNDLNHCEVRRLLATID